MTKIQNKILIINGSIRGANGNSGRLAEIAIEILRKELHVDCELMILTNPKNKVSEVYEQISNADGFLVISGVYWNNWSSALQRFIEVVTPFENSEAFFGKPIACAVTMDSVGGTEVASRIHSVFAGLGCWSPPCSTLVISRVGQEAIAASANEEDDPNEDVWRTDDIEIVLKNLIIASTIRQKDWVTWPHVELKIADDAWPESGALDMDSPKFI